MSLGLFLLIMLIISFFRFKIFRLTFICFCVLIAILLSVSAVRNWSRNLSCGRSALLIYKGIPIPYFDFLIYPDGYCHLIDKKKYFRTTDKDYMLRQRPNIIVVGAGRDGSGGKGFDQGLGTHFVYNRYTLKGTQVIILPTPDAVRKFNQLKDLHKSVFLVMHNN
jgi:hypothetical protein